MENTRYYSDIKKYIQDTREILDTIQIQNDIY